MRNKNKLLLAQLDRKLKPFHDVKTVQVPTDGWVQAIRVTLNMTLRQLGQKLGVTSSGAKDIERRESTGSITLKSLREVGNALDMQLVYGFVPKEGSIEKMVELRAKELARKIVLRTSHNMQLEAQGNSSERITQAIGELTEELKREMSRSIWD